MCVLLVSLVLLIVFHVAGDPAWVHRLLSPTPGSDTVLWTVQTTFLSVGFAGLTIAAQLFAEAPLAIGTSRKRILAYVGASWFVAVGLAANAAMAIESIWLPSATGVVITFAWFVATAVLLLVSTSRLTHLFGHPSRLDEVVRTSLVETLSNRFGEIARRYAGASRGLEELLTTDTARTSTRSASTLHVPVPQAGRVVRAIKAEGVREAIASLDPEGASAAPTPSPYEVAPQVLLDVHPGDRTLLGATAFRVVTPNRLHDGTAGRMVQLLQSSIELEAPEAVTAYEETQHEIATLQDAIGTNLRSGALATAERALELLGQIVREVWMAELDRSGASRGASLARGSGLLESIVEVERDVLLSPQVAHVFITATTARAVEAAATGSGGVRRRMSAELHAAVVRHPDAWGYRVRCAARPHHRVRPRSRGVLRRVGGRPARLAFGRHVGDGRARQARSRREPAGPRGDSRGRAPAPLRAAAGWTGPR
jgi:hypothetical protein